MPGSQSCYSYAGKNAEPKINPKASDRDFATRQLATRNIQLDCTARQLYPQAHFKTQQDTDINTSTSTDDSDKQKAEVLTRSTTVSEAGGGNTKNSELEQIGPETELLFPSQNLESW